MRLQDTNKKFTLVCYKYVEYTTYTLTHPNTTIKISILLYAQTTNGQAKLTPVSL